MLNGVFSGKGRNICATKLKLTDRADSVLPVGNANPSMESELRVLEVIFIRELESPVQTYDDGCK